MSKRKKNYPDPMHIVNSYGADALRWDSFGGYSVGCVGSLLMADPHQEAACGGLTVSSRKKVNFRSFQTTVTAK